MPTTAPAPSPRPGGGRRRLHAGVMGIDANAVAIVPRAAKSRLAISLSSIPMCFGKKVTPKSCMGVVCANGFGNRSADNVGVHKVAKRSPSVLSMHGVASAMANAVLNAATGAILLRACSNMGVLYDHRGIPSLSSDKVRRNTSLQIAFGPTGSHASGVCAYVGFRSP